MQNNIVSFPPTILQYAYSYVSYASSYIKARVMVVPDFMNNEELQSDQSHTQTFKTLILILYHAVLCQ